MTITAAINQNLTVVEGHFQAAIAAHDAANAAWRVATPGPGAKAAYDALLVAEKAENDWREARFQAELAVETRASRLHRTLRHLTGAEQDRLLAKLGYRDAALAATVWAGEFSLQYDLDDIYSEQVSERGSATRQRTTLDAFLQVNPRHTCDTAPWNYTFDAAASAWVEAQDEVPF